MFVVAVFLCFGLAVGQSLRPLKLCDTRYGYASTDDSSFLLDIGGYKVRPNEAIVIFVRPFESRYPTPTLWASLNVGGIPGPPRSSNAEGILEVGKDPRGNPVSANITVTSQRKPLPFQLTSFVANYPFCAIRIQDATEFYAPLLQSTGVNSTVASLYLELSAQTTTNFNLVFFSEFESLTAVWKQSSSAVDGAFSNSVSVPVLSGIVAPPQMVFLKITPKSAPVSPQLWFGVSWKVDGGNTPQHPSGIPVPSIPSPSELEPEEAGTVLGSLFGMFLLAIIIYFVARSAYNFSHGEREFPKFIPHHEAIGAALSSTKRVLHNAATGRKVAGVSRREEYEDVPRE